MNDQDRDLFDPRIADWLEEDPYKAPDQTIQVVLAAFPSIRRRHAQRLPWRFNDMNGTLKLATIAAAVVLAIGGAAWMLGQRPGAGVGGPPPTTSASPAAAPSPPPPGSSSPSPSPSPVSTVDWVPFTSIQYGYRISHPPSWTATAATRAWVSDTDKQPVNEGADHFIDENAVYGIGVTGFAVDVAVGTSDDAWITDYYKDPTTGANACGVTIANLVPTTVDGHPARIGISTCADEQAFVFFDGRVHVFSVWRDGEDPLFRAFLSTVRFAPAPPGGSAAPSASGG